MDPSRLMTMETTVTPRTVTTTDAYGDDTLTDGTAFDTVCFIWQTERGEDTGPDHTVDETYTAAFPAADTIGPADAVTAEGVDYEIIGPPWPAFNPRLQTVTHQEATLRRVA